MNVCQRFLHHAKHRQFHISGKTSKVNGDIKLYVETATFELLGTTREMVYAVAPNLTDTSLETPGSCMVTP